MDLNLEKSAVVNRHEGSACTTVDGITGKGAVMDRNTLDDGSIHMPKSCNNLYRVTPLGYKVASGENHEDMPDTIAKVEDPKPGTERISLE